MIDKRYTYAVAGASNDPSKYGHKVLKDLLNKGFNVYPLNPKAEEVLGKKAYKELDELPETIDVLITVTPPPVTDTIVRQAVYQSIEKIWMQPGSFTEEIVKYCNDNNIDVIAGACIMMEEK